MGDRAYKQIPTDCGWLRKKYEEQNTNSCSVVTETFGVLSLVRVVHCYSYSEIESVIIYCNSAWQSPINRVSNPELTSYLSLYLANTRQYNWLSRKSWRYEKCCLVVNIWNIATFILRYTEINLFYLYMNGLFNNTFKTLDFIALNDTLIMNNELERMWTEVIVA
jgi:hypothetical protein